MKIVLKTCLNPTYSFPREIPESTPLPTTTGGRPSMSVPTPFTTIRAHSLGALRGKPALFSLAPIIVLMENV